MAVVGGGLEPAKVCRPSYADVKGKPHHRHLDKQTDSESGGKGGADPTHNLMEPPRGGVHESGAGAGWIARKIKSEEGRRRQQGTVRVIAVQNLHVVKAEPA